jgi:[FeFe] hydrogenase H-cluster maturation GTPase HydF
MNKTPLAEQIRIVLFGMRNSGKSSLMNNLFERDISIISDMPGTTTDPVTRTIELDKLGPVAVCDTAGFDDTGEVGHQRVKKTYSRYENADIIIMTTRSDKDLTEEEKYFLNELKDKRKNLLVVLTFGDNPANENKQKFLEEFKLITVDNISKKGIKDFKTRLISFHDKIEHEITPLEGLVHENDFVILVTPIDLAAPKGRLILPQVETIRDILDNDCAALILKERELKYFYDKLTVKPKLVITDSQAFNKVAADIPADQALTSFSILFARKKGDLKFFVEGIKALNHVPKNAKILILESCSHHRLPDDIGTVKIPRLFKQLAQSKVEFDFARSLPESSKLQEYFMVINCAGCMVTRKLMINRLNVLKEKNIYGINYGLFLAWANGLLPRALEPFPAEYELYKSLN